MCDSNHESDAENGNHKYAGADSIDGGVGTSRRLSDVDEPMLQKKRKELADFAVWMSGLGATKLPLDDSYDLCNGRAFAEILHEIDKAFFDEKWLETMPTFTTNTNIVVKRVNLRKLWRKISDYITQVINRQIPAVSRWTEISERVDGIEETDLPVAVDFAMLIVTLAHIGRTKEKFVPYSREISGKKQSAIETVAKAISKVMEELPEDVSYHETCANHDTADESIEMNESSFATSTSGSLPGNTNGFVEHRRRSSNSQSLLEAHLDAIKKEKDNLVKEVDRLTKALDAAQLNSSTSSEQNDIRLLETQNEELRIKKRTAEEKILELEAQHEQLRLTIEELTHAMEDLRSGQKDVSLLRNELHSALDEVEVWRTRADQLAKDQDGRKKLEKEVKDLQAREKSLTARLEHHVKLSSMDDDVKETTKQLRAQLGTMSAMKDTLEIQLKTKERTVHDLEQKLILSKEKVKELEDRKDDLTAERDALQKELLMKDAFTARSLHESMFEGGNLSFEDNGKMSADVDKTTLPLEIENKRLREQILELEDLIPLRGEITVLKSRNGELEEQNLVVEQQNEELQKKLAEMERQLTESQQHVRGDVVELKLQLERSIVEVERLREAESRAEKRVAEVEYQMQQKVTESDKLNASLNSAKVIIDVLEEQCRPVGEDNGTSVHQFKELQSENERLRQENEKLKIQLESDTKTLEQENRLLTTAAHQMVLNRSVDEVMSMRAQGGADSVHTEPQTLLETQKMSGALPWRPSLFSVRQAVPSAKSIIISIVLIIVFAWFLTKIFSEMNAPPIA